MNFEQISDTKLETIGNIGYESGMNKNDYVLEEILS